MLQEGEALMGSERLDIAFRPSLEIVEAENRVTAIEQGGAQVRTDEPGTAGNDGVQLLLLRSPVGRARPIYCAPIRSHK